MKQKAEITFEVEETIVVRQGEKIKSEFCPMCQDVTTTAPPRVLALVADSTEREIFRLIEAGVIYFTEDKQVRACLECVRECLKEPNADAAQQSLK